MEAREGTGSPGYGIRGSCEAPDVCAELILDALEFETESSGLTGGWARKRICCSSREPEFMVSASQLPVTPGPRYPTYPLRATRAPTHMSHTFTHTHTHTHTHI